MTNRVIICICLWMFLVVTSCSFDDDKIESVSLAGGETTVEAEFSNAFQIPAPNMSMEEFDFHRQGDALFEGIFITPPAPAMGGLGPLFVQNSCASCHKKNGSAAFPLSSGDMGGVLARVSLPGHDNPYSILPVPGYGTQIQTKATFGVLPEAKLSYHTTTVEGSMMDGTKYNLRQPNFFLENFYVPFPSNAQMSIRIAPPILGLGLLEAIREEDIVAWSDPEDKDVDGISGRPNYVYDIRTKSERLGRFGWKANQSDLYNQTAQAYLEDMGVTSPFLTKDPSYGQLQHDNKDDDPEIPELTVLATTFYTQSLGVPDQRKKNDGDVIYGKKLFHFIGCQSCHKSEVKTGIHPEYSFLSNQTIHPYTDLLLHDMGEELADHRPDGKANGLEWRTPPLWGIGLREVVGGHTNYLHDGRARNVEEAILWHGGEALKSRENYKKLSKSDRQKLLLFLNSL